MHAASWASRSPRSASVHYVQANTQRGTNSNDRLVHTQCASKSSECFLKDVMCIVRTLLRMHEVKLALQLVDDFATAPIAATVLSATPDELREAFARFVSKRHSDNALEVGGDGLLELERCARHSGHKPAGAHLDSSQTAHFCSEGAPARTGPAAAGQNASLRMFGLQHTLPAPLATEERALSSSGFLSTGQVMHSGAESDVHEIMDLPSTHAPAPMPAQIEYGRANDGVSSMHSDESNQGGVQVRVGSVHSSDVRPPGMHLAPLLIEDCASVNDIHPPETCSAPLLIEDCNSVYDIPSSKKEEVAGGENGSTTKCRSPQLNVGHSGNELGDDRPAEQNKKVKVLNWVNDIPETESTTVLHLMKSANRTSVANAHGVVPTRGNQSLEKVKKSVGSLEGSLSNQAWMGVERQKKHVSMQVHESWLSVPSNRFLISPNGTFRIFWDVLSLLFIVNESILVPLGMCFDLDVGEEIFWISTSFFTIDMVLNFCTGYYNDGVLVMKHFYIIKHYCKTWFPLDASSTFPWHLVFQSGNATLLKFVKFGKLTRVFRLLRVVKLTFLLEQIEELIENTGVVVMMKLGKILAFMGLLCHWCACFWGWLGHPSRFQGEFGQHGKEKGTCEPGGPCEPSILGSSWRRRYGVESETLGEQYLFSLRFATGIFTGSDFGIQPGFWGEWLFVIMLMFASFLLCSTIVSKIVIIFHKMNEDVQEQEELMLSFKEFMVAGRVPFQLQAKIKRYLEYQFKSRKDLQVRRFELMDKLSPWLRKELQVHLNRSVLALHSFFKYMPGEILAHTCCLATCVLCAPGDVVMQRGQNIQCMYFVVKGKLTIAADVDGGFSIKMQATQATTSHEDDFVEREGIVLTAPGYIGASTLFSDQVRPHTVSSLAHSELLKIARDDVEALIEEFPALRSYTEEYKVKLGASEEGYQDCSMPLFQNGKSTMQKFGTRRFLSRVKTRMTKIIVAE